MRPCVDPGRRPVTAGPSEGDGPMKRTMIGMAVLALALCAPVGAAAGRGESVDPALMQPALNASFGPWECWRTGAGITCEGQRTLTAVGVETGFVCDGRPVYTNEVDVRTQRRYGDENGLALKTVQHVDIRGRPRVGAGPQRPEPRRPGDLPGDLRSTSFPATCRRGPTATPGWTSSSLAPGSAWSSTMWGSRRSTSTTTCSSCTVRIPSWRTSRAAFAGVCPALEEMGA